MKNAKALQLIALAGLLGANSPSDSIYYRSRREADATLPTLPTSGGEFGPTSSIFVAGNDNDHANDNPENERLAA